MQLRPYWLDTAPAFEAGAEGPLEGRCDVAVVGGGFTGLSAALALAKRGASVVVLEADRVGAAASGRNGGHCNNGLAHGVADLVERLGFERTRALYRAYDRAVDAVETLVAEEEIDCSFIRSGKIRLASKPHHYRRLARDHEVLSRGIDDDTEMVPAADLGREVRSASFHGGLLQRRSAMLHVGRFGRGLAEAAVRRGVRIFEGAAVTALSQPAAGRHLLSTARGTLEADQVLVATGAYTTGPFGYFRRRVIPLGSFVVATEPLGSSGVEEIMPGRRTAVTTRHIGNYFRISPDDRLIFGGRARFALSSSQSDRASGRILERQLRRVFPQLGQVRIDYCWGGLIDVTADRLPRAGEHEGLFYAMGYSGHGVQMSVLMGQSMAEVMAGRPEANPWRDFDWPAVPGHLGKPWFLPLVGAYYRTLDLIH